MHEISLMHEAVRIALTHAERNGAARVHALTMRVGPLAGVEVESLRLAFQVVTSETAADGATLQIDDAPVRCWCAGCDRMFQPADVVFCCPHCEQLSDDVRQGRELDLIAVEVS